jgi:hypothetical protein
MEQPKNHNHTFLIHILHNYNKIYKYLIKHNKEIKHIQHMNISPQNNQII